ncbi:soyasapogenol B glucuronide galactosyltransferase-like, partial [Trifolium medium]|nr:soyasapogenol B glucuronide galactosyltransferase-like [Trifolium medium]
FDSYHEIEGTYEDHYKTAMGTKSWSVGPVSLWVNQDDSDKAGRGMVKNKMKKKMRFLSGLIPKKRILFSMLVLVV